MIYRKDVFDTYWYFAAERQEIFFNVLAGKTPPYTNDPILQKYKFCNTYRASDRVSQFLIHDVIYKKTLDPLSTALRIIFFRFINKVETWEKLEESLEDVISIKNFNMQKYSKILNTIKDSGKSIYGNAFILASTNRYGLQRKHDNHLKLLHEIFFENSYIKVLLSSRSLKELFDNLHTLPMIGDFMAYQIAIDLNYSELFDFNEDDFTIAGPGAMRGIAKCFIDTEGRSSEYIIKWMVENQEKQFHRLGIKFKFLFGRRLHAIDCQGLFCETDKYCREKFPELISNRLQIKSKYKIKKSNIDYFYPPKWNLNLSINP